MTRRALQVLATAAIGFFLLAGPAAAACSAGAGQTCITFPTGNTVFADGFESINITAQTVSAFSGINSNSSISAGGFGATAVVPTIGGDGATTNLFWCTDLAEDLISGSNAGLYNIGSLTDAHSGAQYPNTPTATQAGYITSLLYNAEANSSNTKELSQLTDGTRSAWSAALQLAIWAVLYDGSGIANGYSITSSSNKFYVNSDNGSGSAGDAQTLLNCVLGGTCSNGLVSSITGFASLNLEPTSGSNQSIGYLITSSTSVPEPPSIALLAAGLVALPLLRRRPAARNRAA